MKIIFQLLLFIVVLFFPLEEINAQFFFKKLDKNLNYSKKNTLYKKKNFPTKFELFSIEEDSLHSLLKSKSINAIQTIKLPNSKGGFSSFAVKETSNFDANLSEKFPTIKSYSAQGIDDPAAVAKISVGTDGFHAVVFSAKEKTLYIDPYSKDHKTVIVYKRNDLEPNKDEFNCMVKEVSRNGSNQEIFRKNANDGVLRTFRLALVCSGEYAQFHLANQNIAPSATNQVKKAAVLSAINTTLTRVNGVFEKDLSVKMVLVANNDEIVFLDTATDNISDGDPDLMIDEVQSICDAKIGNVNYDIGHIFSVGGDGLAGRGVVCITGEKAKGVTGRSQPIGDAYDIDYVVHEMGHQFGANHTQNNDCNRYDPTAVEPGSASTIMGYAGICAPNVQGQSDDHFHAVSIAEMWNIIQNSATCAMISNTGNAAPTANAGIDFSIPKSTPFVLKGIATDADGIASLTYNWEQIDNGIGAMPPMSTNSNGPMFRALQPQTSPNRYMPALATVVSGEISSTWEVLPSVKRDLNFSFLVRDNHAGGGSTARDDVKVSVENAEAFKVSSQTTDNALDAGSTQTITWIKGTTDILPINCKNVNIKLSIDGGLTFPIMLKENTPNDGTEDVIIPNNPSTSCRIMIAAADNIFYNINTTEFTINSIVPTFVLRNTSGVQTTCNLGDESVSFELQLDYINNFSETVTLSASGNPVGSTVLFSTTTITGDSNVTMTISNLENSIINDYTLNIKATSATVNKDLEVVLDVNSATFSPLTLTLPLNESTDIGLFDELKWKTDRNALIFNVEIATDANFTNIVSDEEVSDNFYTPTNLLKETIYFWRVKAINNCGEGEFSNTYSFTTVACDVCASNGSEEFLTAIRNVEFNTIENASAKPTGTDGYSDFRSLETDVFINKKYNLSVNTNTDGDFRVQTKAWIDWNQNCVFDVDEEYDLGFSENGTNITTSESPITIMVPQDAKTGTTVLRISTKYTDRDPISYPTSCATNFDGEVEDYTVIVNRISIYDAVFEDFNLYPNPTDGEFTLNLKLANTAPVSVILYDLRGRLVDQKQFLNTTKNFSEKVLFDKISAGLYLLKITNGNKYTTIKIIIE